MENDLVVCSYIFTNRLDENLPLFFGIASKLLIVYEGSKSRKLGVAHGSSVKRKVRQRAVGTSNEARRGSERLLEFQQAYERLREARRGSGRLREAQGTS